jgi:membrane carboxypeptidase/penicillin-binding protein PbpC
LSEALTLAVLPQNRRAGRRGGGPALRERGMAVCALAGDASRVEGEADLMQLGVHMGSPAGLPFRAPHLVDAVIANGDGPEIHTTLDGQLQDVLERQIHAYVAAQVRLGVHNAAAMLVDARTMGVKALVGRRILQRRHRGPGERHRRRSVRQARPSSRSFTLGNRSRGLPDDRAQGRAIQLRRLQPGELRRPIRGPLTAKTR